jgi:uncharacterized protein YndB with AHSA1/START domain/predicted enzyme related to lactoylglutathione lyase
MLLGLRTLGFPVDDLAAAKAFYTGALGTPPYFDEPFYVGFDVAGYELGLTPSEGGVDAPGATGGCCYLGTDDVAADAARLEALGARVVTAPHEVGGGIVVATLLDPFGNKLGLIHNPHFRVPSVGAVVVSDRPGTIVSVARGGSPRRIDRETTIPVEPDAAYAMWTSSAAIARWLVPESRVELRIGGAYELIFLPPEMAPTRGSEGCRILSYLPGEMLSFTWNAPPELPATRDLRTIVVVRFDPARGGTRVRLTHHGWPEQGWEGDDGQWPATFAYFEVAWTRVIEALEGHFAPT